MRSRHFGPFRASRVPTEGPNGAPSAPETPRLVWRPPARATFPIAVVDPALCTACGLCTEICPTEAIAVAEIAVVDPGRCASCGVCVEACPEGALDMTATSTPLTLNLGGHPR